MNLPSDGSLPPRLGLRENGAQFALLVLVNAFVGAMVGMEQLERRNGVGTLSAPFAGANMSLERIGILSAIYPATWGVAQLATGALSDRIGRKWLIVSGMWLQAIGIAIVILSSRFLGFAVGAWGSAWARRWFTQPCLRP